VPSRKNSRNESSLFRAARTGQKDVFLFIMARAAHELLLPTRPVAARSFRQSQSSPTSHVMLHFATHASQTIRFDQIKHKMIRNSMSPSSSGSHQSS
jgi:hypothetical protein